MEIRGHSVLLGSLPSSGLAESHIGSPAIVSEGDKDDGWVLAPNLLGIAGWQSAEKALWSSRHIQT